MAAIPLVPHHQPASENALLQTADTLDHLASVIQTEIQELGGSQAVPADAVMEVAKARG